MIDNNLFLKEDLERAQTLLNEHDRFINLSRLELGKGNYRDAEEYADHAIKLLAEVRKLKELNDMYKESHDIKKQAKIGSMTDQMLATRRNYFLGG